MKTFNPQKSSSQKFELCTAKPENSVVPDSMSAGVAYNYPGEAHYVLRLSMFPKNFYYLTKDTDSIENYTVYSRRVVDPADPLRAWFQNPVGFGQLRQDLQSHLEIRFALLSGPIFMNLYPMD